MTIALKVSVRRGGPTARPGESLIVTLDGELDIASVPSLGIRFDELPLHGLGQIVVDVSELTFIDVAGLRALAALRTRAGQRQVAVRLTGVSPRMRQLMKIVGFAWNSPPGEQRDSGHRGRSA